MRIDADCHLAAPSNGTGIGADELIRRLDEVGVDRHHLADGLVHP